MANESDMTALEVVPLGAIHAMERAQIDTQVATAHQYPRNLEQFKKRSIAMSTLDGDTAESCIYVRPVGKEKNAAGQWVDKYAEGPSIRMAEIVGCCYGNLRVASRIIEQTPRYVKAEGTCHDLESNFAAKADIIESTVGRDGQPYSERQQALIAKVAVAKAFRDAIFRVVPRALIKPGFEAAKRVIAGTSTTISERIKKVQAWLSTKKIGQDRVFFALGITSWEQITEDHLMTLTGLKTAIQDGEPIDEIFPAMESSTSQPGPHSPAPTPLQRSQQPQPANPSPNPNNKAASVTPPPVEQPVKRPIGRPPKAATVEAQEVVESAPTPAAQQEPSIPVETQAEQSDEASLSTLGLAPEQPAAEPAPAQDDKPMFQPVKGEPESLTNLRQLMFDSGVDEATVMRFCTANKLAMGEKTLADFITNGRGAKLTQLAGAWKVILPKIKA